MNSFKTAVRWRSLITISWSRLSARIERTIRSAIALAFGAIVSPSSALLELQMRLDWDPQPLSGRLPPPCDGSRDRRTYGAWPNWLILATRLIARVVRCPVTDELSAAGPSTF